jgi:predicted GIY-YIG superfamily endonuclease
MWSVYLLELADDDIYVGSTDGLRRRFASPQKGQVLSIKAYRPLTLESYIAVQSEGHARRLERYLKTGSGKAFAKKRLLE